MRHQTFNTGNKIIVVSHYAGKAVKGYAKCSPVDTFSYETGKDLATLRCDEKIAKKRIKRAQMRLAEAQEAFSAAQKQLLDMQSYLTESKAELTTIQTTLKQMEADL